MNRYGLSIAALSAVTFAVATLSGGAEARHGAKHHSGKHQSAHHPRAQKVHYGGRKGVGYWRRGPKTGYGFAFSSYRKDPFGDDDYWDGGRCYYVHHQNFCMANKIFNGFE